VGQGESVNGRLDAGPIVNVAGDAFDICTVNHETTVSDRRDADPSTRRRTLDEFDTREKKPRS
jgi:hypothetical protein